MEELQLQKEINKQLSNELEHLRILLKIQQSTNTYYQDTITTPIGDIKQIKYDNSIVADYICLVCNQLFTTTETINHFQHNRDHIDHCLHINNIKNQLSDINSINTNNNDKNNIFKKRLETIWSELTRLTTIYSSLNSKINEISDHFKTYHEFLRIKEHSLKKEIQDDIGLINNDITQQINELKSIFNIININNLLNNKNISDGNDNTNPILSEIEDTTDKYKSTTIIESIQQSQSFNNFIENNKNTLFYFNNKSIEYNNNKLPFLSFINNHNRNFNSSLLNPTEIYSQSIKINENQYIIQINDQHCYKLQKLISESIVIDKSQPFLLLNDIVPSTEITELLPKNRKEVLTSKSFLMDTAASIGDLEKIKLLHENRSEGCTTKSMDFAAKSGYFEIVKWLHENRTEGCTTRAMDDAAEYGHFEIIKWLHHNRTEGCKTNAMNNAAKNGHLEIIKWLQHNRTEGCTVNAMNNAAENGHLEIIKWLQHNRTEGCTTLAMEFAAMNGYLEIIKWLHHNRTEGCTYNAMNYAAMHGHLEIIKWLHHNRTEGCTTRAMDNAAENGHFEIVKWLHQNRTEGCTTDAVHYAADNRHFEIAKWLHEIQLKAAQPLE